MSIHFADRPTDADAGTPRVDEDFDYIPWWTTDTMSSVLNDVDTDTWCLLCDLVAGTTATIRHESPRNVAAVLTAVMEALWMRQPIRHTTAPADRQIPDRFAPLTTPEPDIRELGRIGAAWCVARLAAFTQDRPFPGRGCRHHRLDEIAAEARRILSDDDGSWLYTGSLAARYDHERPFATPEFVDAITTIANTWLSDRDAIEFGAGTGAITRIAALHTRSLIAIEPALGMRTELRQHMRHHDHVQIRGEDCMSVDLADACADVVFEHAALCFVDEPLFAVAEAARLLRPGGSLVRILSSTRLPDHVTAFTAEFHAQLRRLGHRRGRIVSSGNDSRITEWLASAGIVTRLDSIATWDSEQTLGSHAAPLLYGSYPYLSAIPADDRDRAMDAALAATHLDWETPIDCTYTVQAATSPLGDVSVLRQVGQLR
ncbi:class I SAM-dependent methyltransferase [Nocardia sp. NPDC050630]|uniref:class I SAM-dependent methyltransferase n=1 Tax=Nocardia sp. NPDC050630 TaxID=3364321 RepID=UPI0037B7CFF8